MKLMIRTTLLATLILVQPIAGYVHAEEDTRAENGDISFSGNATVISEYRFRGVAMSAGDIAIQGGFDVEKGGFSLGTWGSSIDTYNGSEIELDIYGGYGFDLGDVTLNVGGIAYTYPGSDGTTYYEGNASLVKTIAGADVAVGVAYVPSQSNTGDVDNVYIFSDLSYAFADSPMGIAAHFAYEDGAFGADKLDWSLGFTYSFDIMSVGISYVDTNKMGKSYDGAVLFSIGASY